MRVLRRIAQLNGAAAGLVLSGCVGLHPAPLEICPVAAPEVVCPSVPLVSGTVNLDTLADAYIDLQEAYEACQVVVQEWEEEWSACTKQ